MMRHQPISSHTPTYDDKKTFYDQPGIVYDDDEIFDPEASGHEPMLSRASESMSPVLKSPGSVKPVLYGAVSASKTEAVITSAVEEG